MWIGTGRHLRRALPTSTLAVLGCTEPNLQLVFKRLEVKAVTVKSAV